ncbi:hypothetical protein [Anaerotignum sp.]|uniref:hypothetical protein n=1 Tax=Anaerotignum sp. TaxID=2039241 RepID=UPI0028AE1EC5|nr:hypothetical protein [Anaerotignum sp.]
MEEEILKNTMDKKKQTSKENIVLAATIDAHSQLHAEASSQIIQGYNGVRYDSYGNDLGHVGRSLKGVSAYKVNPEYEANNIRQQAGFSAELLTEARANAKNILEGNSERVRTADGVGKTNDQVNDLYTVDGRGNILETGKAQSKFLSKPKTPESSHEQVVDNFIRDPKWEKYANSKMSVPSDQLEKAKNYAERQRLKYIEKAQEAKDLQVQQSFIEKAKKAEQIRDNLVDSGVSSKDAIEARLHPKAFVAKETIKNIHSSSLDIAKGAAIVAGTVSMGKNLYAVITEDKGIEEAITDTVAETATISAKAYGINTAATGMSIVLKNATSTTFRRLGASPAPLAVTTAAVEIGNSLGRYAKNEIDEEELLLELGEKGTGAIAANYGAAVGTMVLPGIGTIVGGMIGYTISGVLYQSSLAILQREKLSEQRRILIESIVEESICEMKRYSENLKEQAIERCVYRENIYQTFFNDMYKSIEENDIDYFFSSIDYLGNFFGLELRFQTFIEFDEFMNDDNAILTI